MATIKNAIHCAVEVLLNDNTNTNAHAIIEVLVPKTELTKENKELANTLIKVVEDTDLTGIDLYDVLDKVIADAGDYTSQVATHIYAALLEVAASSSPASKLLIELLTYALDCVLDDSENGTFIWNTTDITDEAITRFEQYMLSPKTYRIRPLTDAAERYRRKVSAEEVARLWVNETLNQMCLVSNKGIVDVKPINSAGRAVARKHYGRTVPKRDTSE